VKNLLTLTLLGLCLVAAAPSSSAQTMEGPLKKKFQRANLLPLHDAASDTTSVYMMPMGLTGRWKDTPPLLTAALGSPVEGIRFTVYFTYPGRAYAPPRQVMFRLNSTNRGGPGLTSGEEVEVALKADGVVVSSAKSAVKTHGFKSDNPKSDTEYVEQMSDIPLTVEELGRLAASKKAEVVVAGRSIPLKGQHLKALQRVADAIAAEK